MFPEKRASGLAPKCLKGLEERLTVPARDAGHEGALGLVQRLQPRRLTRATLRSELRPDRPAVAGIVGTDHQLLGLEPIDELGDVRAYAGAALGQRAQREGLARGYELGEDSQLGQGQA